MKRKVLGIVFSVTLIGGAGMLSAHAQTPTPTPTATAKPTASYENCDEARAAGAAPIRKGEPGYSPELDRDGDGIACEQDGNATPAVTATATPTTAAQGSLRVSPGGCGIIDDKGTVQEFVRVTVSWPGKRFHVSYTGSEGLEGPYTDHLDYGFPVKPGKVEVRVTDADNPSNPGLVKSVNITKVCNISATPTPTPTASEAPGSKLVTAKYECGAATFYNPLAEPVKVTYGPAQSDAGIKTVTIKAGSSATVNSTEKQFGWTARTLKGTEVGHRYLPGEDLSCDEPDDSKPTAKPTTKKPGAPMARSTVKATPLHGRGLAATGA